MPLQAIVPRTKFKNPGPEIARSLFKWKGDVIRPMQKYPTQQAHITYIRKGSGGYGGAWKFSTKKDEATVFNNIDHAVFLGGPTVGPKGKRAAEWARRYGWRSLREVSIKPNKALTTKLGTVLRTALRFEKV